MGGGGGKKKLVRAKPVLKAAAPPAVKRGASRALAVVEGSEAAAPPQRSLALDAETSAALKSQLARRGKGGVREGAGVLYLGHIPHGFYEAQMRGFFSQFGDVSKLRLSRNKKTGRSRHYAFIEFADRHVAAVVAETMDGYLLCNKQLVCKVVDPEKLHERVWVGANKKFQKVPWRSIARNQLNQRRSAEKQRARQERLVQKENKKRAKLQKLGIDYEFEGYREALPKKPQRTRF